MRAPVFCFCFALLSTHIAQAQSAGGYSIDPSKEAADYHTTVTDESPDYTQDRNAAGSRYWRLDTGRYQAEVWWKTKYKRSGSQSGLLQAEIEMGIAPHLQLDIYQNFSLSDGAGGFGWGGVEGTQVELRIAFGRTYNEIPLNPVLYLEWHPKRSEPDRVEAKLLLGGDITPSLLGIVNIYVETNVDALGDAHLGLNTMDMEFGVSGALSWALDVDHFRVGIEGQIGFDQHGNDLDLTDPNAFYPVYLVGPNILFKVPEANLKLTATCFFGISDNDPRLYPLVILAKGW